MLLAPRASSDATEVERFHVTQVNNALQLADQLMNPHLPFLHKVGYHEAAFEFLLDQLRQFLQYHPSQFDVILQQAHRALKQIQESKNLSCEIDHVWARLIKYVFMNANILEMNDIRMNCCRSIYLMQLKRLLEESFTETSIPSMNKKLYHFDKLNRPDAQMLFSEFIGQLLRLGFEANVKAIHDFLYLAKKVSRSPSSGMSVEQIAVTIAPCFLRMLFAEKVLCPVDAPEQETEQMKKESQFMGVLLTCLLRTNRFDSPYDSHPYKDYRQAGFNALYQNVMPTIIDPVRLTECSNNPNKLADLLKKLQIKDKGLSSLSPDMLAALAMKKDEPIVRVASSDKLLSRVPRSRRLKETFDKDNLVPPSKPLIFSDSTAETDTLMPVPSVDPVSPSEPEKNPKVQLQ